MPIQQPTEIVTEENFYSILIAGYPGIGKTTLALSAPDPLHIDVDDGIRRVRAAHRKPYIHPNTYEELLADLVPEVVKPYKTLVFDTGGSLFSLLTRWAIAMDAKNGKRNGGLSLPGYGVVGKEFIRLDEYCRKVLKKHVVHVFHAKEDKDGDDTKLRILIEGQTKDNIWQPIDVGGFIQMVNGRRVLGTTNCERYFAKGSYGVHGELTIPELDEDGTAPNDFLTRLFERMDTHIKAEAEVAAQQKAEYEAVMVAALDIIGGIDTPEKATAAVEQMKTLEHKLTSEREAKTAFSAKIKALGYKYDREKGCYYLPEPEPTESDTKAADTPAEAPAASDTTEAAEAQQEAKTPPEKGAKPEKKPAAKKAAAKTTTAKDGVA